MSRHPLMMTLDVQQRSGPLAEEVIEAYRKNGDEATKDLIIRHFIPLAIGIAGNYARRFSRHRSTNFAERADELASVAMLALTQAVDWCGPRLSGENEFVPSRLRDNNIEPYIKTTVVCWIRKAISEDRVIGVPGRTRRQRTAAGRSILDPQMCSLEELHEEAITLPGFCIIPIAKREEPSLEFEESLSLAICSPHERRVIDLRREGYSYVNIADLLGLSVSMIGRIVHPVEERFFKIYA